MMLTDSWKRAPVAAAIMLMILLCVGVDTTVAQGLGDLTGPWQLLVDDYLVSEKSDLTRTYHQFDKYSANPVMEADRPWEAGFIYMYGTVLPTEAHDGYRMWYHCYDRSASMYRNLYATSSDGITWDKPSLGIVEYGGSTNNNLFIQRSSRDHLPQVIHTPWEEDPNRRYKLMAYDYSMKGFRGATSPDGIHWTDVSGNPVLDSGGQDVGNFVWDTRAQRYLGTPKINTSVRGFNRRCVGVSFTEDFESWPNPQLILVPDEIDDYWVAGGGQHTDFYGLSAFAYESGYIGFLWIFQITDGGNDGPIWPELVSSRDGVHWTQQEPGGESRTPLLELGPPGSWDDGMIFTPNHPLVEDDTIKLYYGGIDDTHGYPAPGNPSAAIGLSTLRKDGFASLDAGTTTGTVTTKLLENMSGPLLLNVNAAGGWLRAEVLDDQGSVIPGYSLADCNLISADGVSLPVSWGTNAELPVSQEPMQLRFVLNGASLYSFMAGEGVDLPEVPLIGTFDRSGVLYTFEGDTSTTITDKLIADGSQDPWIFGDVSVVDDPAQAAFGDRSASFPDSPSTGTLLEIPETSNLGKAFTLAAMVDETGEDFSRLFSAYNGGPAAEDELLFDADPSGMNQYVPGMRAIVHGTYVIRQAQFDDDQYHHVAMTYNDGKVRLYLDGVQLGDEETVPGGVVELAYNLRFGEDYSPTSQTNEPFEGRADDILVYRRPLAPSQVQALAQNGAEVFFSGPHGIHYTAEGDTVSATDVLAHDGTQEGIFQNGVSVDNDPANARLGNASYELTAGESSWSTIELLDSSYLGDAFTLASFVNVTADNHQRLFSSYDGNGPLEEGEFIFDFSPDGGQFNGLRAILGGSSVVPDEPVSFPTGEYHHLAMTFEDGLAILYLDGEEVANGTLGDGPINLARNLRFGEDWDGTADEQFLGHADEILLLLEALSPGDVYLLAHPDLLPGDANSDGVVNDQDAAILASHWQQSTATWSEGDFNGDGEVNDQDAAILATHWQQTANPEGTPVPEPGTAVLFLGGLGLLGCWALACLLRLNRTWDRFSS